MTLDELIERLQELREDLMTGEGEVFIASQPGYPIRQVVANVTAEANWGQADPHSDTVWIAVDQDENAPYAPREAWTE